MKLRMNRHNKEPKGKRARRLASAQLRYFPVLATTLLGALALLPAAAQAYTYVPADPPRPCDPAVARCDVELEVVNDRGIPQAAGITLQADVADPNFHGHHGRAPLQFRVKRGLLAFNFSTGAFADGHQCHDSWHLCRKYRFPPPPGINFGPSQGFYAFNYPLQPGMAVYITRNSSFEHMNTSLAYPEKVGQLWTVPAAGYRGRVVLPSFGTPRNPELSDRERGALGALNDLRAASGAERLRAQPDLNAAADNFACWLDNYLRGPDAPGQTGPGIHYAYGSWQMRMNDAGWPRSRSSGENIAYVGSPERAFRQWLDSEGHKENMLNNKFLYVGFGVNCGIAVMKFSGELLPGVTPPWGGWGDDVGDSSLAQWDQEEEWDDDWGDDWFDRRFRPQLSLLRKSARRPTLMIKANRRAQGKMIIRYRGRVKSSGPLTAKVKVGRRGRIVIRFQAATGSAIRSGTVVRCLQAKEGRVLVRGCRKR